MPEPDRSDSRGGEERNGPGEADGERALRPPQAHARQIHEDEISQRLAAEGDVQGQDDGRKGPTPVRVLIEYGAIRSTASRSSVYLGENGGCGSTENHLQRWAPSISQVESSRRGMIDSDLMGLEGKSAFAGLLALCAGAIGAGCHGTSTDSGLIRVAVQAQTTSAQITRVSCAVTPAGVSADLPRTAADTFGGTLTVAVGTQTVRADAFAGSTAVGSGTASVTVTKGAKSQVFITILDSTGPAPQPDHAPVVTSLSVPASTAKVGDQLALAATAMDADGDPIAFSWSVSPAGCGTFAAPAAASTAWTAAAPGDCAVTVTATA